MEDNGCKALLKSLTQSTSSMLRKSTSMIPSKGSLGGGGVIIADIYINLFQDVDQFLKIKRQEVKTSPSKSPHSVPKFSMSSPSLVFPIHDDSRFRYFCEDDQEFTCDYCMLTDEH
jgi:hypothetical protein